MTLWTSQTFCGVTWQLDRPLDEQSPSPTSIYSVQVVCRGNTIPDPASYSHLYTIKMLYQTTCSFMTMVLEITRIQWEGSHANHVHKMERKVYVLRHPRMKSKWNYLCITAGIVMKLYLVQNNPRDERVSPSVSLMMIVCALGHNLQPMNGMLCRPWRMPNPMVRSIWHRSCVLNAFCASLCR